jgi:hypothetical protein
MLSRAKWFACTLITLAVIAGFFIGGLTGVIGAIICFGLGAWYLGSRSKLKIKIKTDHQEVQPILAQPPATPKQPTEVLVTVKEIHAYSPSAIGHVDLAKDQKVDFEVFVHAWLVSETETPVQIKDAQLQIRNSQGPISAERIAGDLEKWYLDYDKEESDMWDTHVERVRERLAELNTTGALECGMTREGWLHFRVRAISPSEYQSAEVELYIEDSSSGRHVGSVNTTRYLSGQAQACDLGDPPHITPLEKPVVGT